MIIIGLGNPEEKYKNTRHNLGFMVLDKISEQYQCDDRWKKHHKAKVLELKTADYVLIKPLTYMNDSGTAIRDYLSYIKATPQDIIVIHDDLDMDFGKIKTVNNSGSGGHNGVQSIINNLRTQNFSRIKIGIKNKKREQIPAERFVLMPFTFWERRKLNKILDQAVQIVNTIR